MTSNIQLYQGDCLEVMKNIPDKSVDLVQPILPQGKEQLDKAAKKYYSVHNLNSEK